MNLTKEERELIKAKREKELQKYLDWVPRQLNEYTDQQKIEEFDKLALDTYNLIKQNRGSDEDDEHWCYEAIMELLDRDKEKVWTYLNKFTG